MKQKLVSFAAGFAVAAVVFLIGGALYSESRYEDGYSLGRASGTIRGELAAYDAMDIRKRWEEDRKLLDEIEFQYDEEMNRKLDERGL